MSTTSAATATATAAHTLSPTRMFFRTSRTIPSMAHARSVFKQLGEYGEMIEYKFLRVIYTYILDPITIATNKKECTINIYVYIIHYKKQCPETQQYLKYGFVVYKDQQGAQNAASQQFIKVTSNLFDKPCDIKIEKSNRNNTNNNNDGNQS